MNLETEVWWDYLDHDLKELLKQSQLLVETAQEWDHEDSDTMKFHDFSFVVFPAAKAYEGFLKNLFLDLELISKKDYAGKRFRIGKALNPTLYKSEMKRHKRYKQLRKKLSVYDKLVQYCGGPELADMMWKTWKECRNVLFHWFPEEKNAIERVEAEEKFQQILDTIALAFKGCKIEGR